MKKLLRIIPILLMFGLFFITSCDKKDCLDCNAAAQHYYEALLSRYCDLSATAPARAKCVSACNKIGEYGIATKMENACNNDTYPSYLDCSNHRDW